MKKKLLLLMPLLSLACGGEDLSESEDSNKTPSCMEWSYAGVDYYKEKINSTISFLLFASGYYL